MCAMAMFSAPDGRVSHGMVCASSSHLFCHLLLGYTSPAVMFASGRKRVFLDDNEESLDDYFPCLITYKYTVNKNRLETQKLQWSDFLEPVLLSSFKSVSFLHRHMHFYLLLCFYHWTQPFSEQ